MTELNSYWLTNFYLTLLKNAITYWLVNTYSLVVNSSELSVNEELPISSAVTLY